MSFFVTGFDGSRRYYQLLILAPLALTALYVGFGLFSRLDLSTPPLALVVFLALPLAWRLARVRPCEDAQAFGMLDAKTAQLHTVFGVLATAAFWIGRHI